MLSFLAQRSSDYCSFSNFSNSLVSIVSRNFVSVLVLCVSLSVCYESNSFVGNGRQQNYEEAKAARAAAKYGGKAIKIPRYLFGVQVHCRDQKCRNPNGVAVEA